MHRSGTSMVARRLAPRGMSLGDPRDMLATLHVAVAAAACGARAWGPAPAAGPR
jgi:hypothetical protein